MINRRMEGMADSSPLGHLILTEAWKRLQSIRQLQLVAFSYVPPSPSWEGKADVCVDVRRGYPSTILFTERGTWRIGRSNEVPFSNIYRWTLAPNKIRLEHLRYGPSQPVSLIDLIPRHQGAPVGNSKVSPWILAGRYPHYCGSDLYSGTMGLAEHGMKLDWTIQGQQKAATIHIVYS
jgi:hypothetical protein